jgi:predicted lipoprotein with Yx(FWY)xxD motif
MIRRTPLTRLAGLAAIPVVVLALGACGKSNTSTSSAGTTVPAATPSSQPSSAAPATIPSPGPSSAQPATVAVAANKLGSILVDSQGRTLYLFEADQGTTSACSGTCATAWPPLIANGQATAGNGANSSLVGTTQRADGSAQVTYNGHPVYGFAKDQKAGDTNGEALTAFGGEWYALSPAGTAIDNS